MQEKSVAGQSGGADRTPMQNSPHTLRSAALHNGAAAWSANKIGTITLRGLELLREDGLADEGENGSQPNN